MPGGRTVTAQRVRQKTDIDTSPYAAQLREAPFPATKDELIDFAARSGAALQLLDELYALPDGDTRYDAIETVLAPLRREA